MPTSILYADGSSRHVEYNVFGLVTRMTDEKGNQTLFSYDASGRQLSFKDALGGVTSYAYDGQNLNAITDALGHTFDKFKYDEFGNLTGKTDALGGTTQSLFDKDGNILETQDALGNSTIFEYNSLGDRTAIVDALQHRSVLNYDSTGNLIATTDAKGNKWQYEYDGNRRLVKEIDALGGVYQTTYDALGNVISATDQNGNTTHFAYDALSRLTITTDPVGNQIRYKYDAVGNLIEIVDAAGNSTKTQYDVRHRPILRTDAEGGEFNYIYDANGNLIADTDPLQRTTSYIYDANNRRTTVVDPLGGRTETTYDAVGNVKSGSDPLGNSTAYFYDALSRLVAKVDPLGNSSSFQYDAAGNLKQSVDREGRIRQFTYDALDRLSSEIWVDAATPLENIQFSYDPNGNLLSTSDGRTKYQFTYDVLDRTQISDNAGSIGLPHLILNYTYDAVGNRLSVLDNQGVRVDALYDARNQVSSLAWQGDNIDSARVNYTYDPKGQVTQIDRISDLIGLDRIGKSQFEYDGTGRASQLIHFDAVDAVLAQYVYEYDLAGQLITSNSSGQFATYSYDLNGQLTSASYSNQANESYTYDKNGNRTEPGIVITAGNRLAADQEFDYSYDREGNLVSKLNRISGARTNYTYDYRNRLTGVKIFASNGLVTDEIEYLYDPLDQRIGTIINGQVTYTIYDNGHAWKDLNSDGSVVTSYLFGPAVDEILARHRTGEGTVWQLTDRLGTVRDHVDAGGTAINHIEYASFGNVVNESNPSVADRFKFTGRDYDTVTGLYDYRARVYDPQTGRFQSQDPLEFSAGDANFYRYVNNSPLNATDPSGLTAISEYGGVQIVCLSYVYPLFKTGIGRAAIKKDIQAEILSFTWTGGDVAAQNVANYSIAALVLELVAKYVATDIIEGPIVIDDYQTAPGSLVFRIASTEKACNEEIDISTAYFLPGPRICFTGDTEILTQRGHVRFDELTTDDKVLSLPEDQPDATPEYKAVEEIFVNRGPIWHLHVNGQLIRTTANHPFYVHGKVGSNANC